MNVVVIIPAYNEETTIGGVISQVFFVMRDMGYGIRVVVVDDGSTDRTAELARQAGARVFSHPINRGLGAALSTGIEAAIRISQQLMVNSQSLIVVTLDADGQHNPADIARVIEPIVKGKADVVIGSRFKETRKQGNKETMPFVRCIANFCGNFFTWLLFGIWVSDSQSGFRAFSADAASKFQLRTSTMEVSSEIIREIARLKLCLVEVPITARYTEYSLSKATGQGFFKGLETLWKLIILKFFR